MFSSLYPSIMAEFNIAPNTQIGKIIMKSKVYEYEDYYNLGNLYSRPGEFIENMVCDNELEFMTRWFHCANYKELLDDIDEYFKKVFDITYKESNGNNRFPFKYNPVFKKDPFVINPNQRTVNPFTFNTNKPEGFDYSKTVIERKHKDVYD